MRILSSQNRRRKEMLGQCLGCGFTLLLFFVVSAGGLVGYKMMERQQAAAAALVTMEAERPKPKVIKPKPDPILKDQASGEVIGDINLLSSHSILVKVKTREILFRKANTEKIYPASLSKMMTILLAIESLPDLEEEITLQTEMFARLKAADASTAGFEAGEKVKVIDLLYGAMLPSGAECSIGLADRIAGSESAYTALMNEKAEKLGMKNTHFTNATGLHDPALTSTADDMAILLLSALKNPTFRTLFCSPTHTSSPTAIHPAGLKMESSVFGRLSSPVFDGGQILGGKTGYTGEAGLCLASLAEKNGEEYILITTNADPEAPGRPHLTDAITAYSQIP